MESVLSLGGYVLALWKSQEMCTITTRSDYAGDLNSHLTVGKQKSWCVLER